MDLNPGWISAGVVCLVAAVGIVRDYYRVQRDAKESKSIAASARQAATAAQSAVEESRNASVSLTREVERYIQSNELWKSSNEAWKRDIESQFRVFRSNFDDYMEQSADFKGLIQEDLRMLRELGQGLSGQQMAQQGKLTILERTIDSVCEELQKRRKTDQ